MLTFLTRIASRIRESDLLLVFLLVPVPQTSLIYEVEVGKLKDKKQRSYEEVIEEIIRMKGKMNLQRTLACQKEIEEQGG